MATSVGPKETLADSVARGDVPGVVALAADAGGVIYAGAFGERELGASVGMTLDTVCWIASMTKPVTAVAAMQLVEQGRLRLDEPLGQLLPPLGAVQVLDGFDADGTPRLRPPRRAITLRHLLTHTAGFSYDTWNPDVGRYTAYVRQAGEAGNNRLSTPLVFDPGERWEYGINLDWVGQAVEAVSGQSLEAYFKDHILGPLGMADTGFGVKPDRRSRLVSRHVRDVDGTLRPIAADVPSDPPSYAGGGGLYSTGPDYIRFLQMLLHGGTFEGTLVLRADTVADMNTNQIGDLKAGVLRTAIPSSSNDFDPYPEIPIRWGLGHMITTQPTPAGRAANSLAWGGLANTYYWIDPTNQVTGVLLTQILPFSDPLVLGLLSRFERAIYDVSVLQRSRRHPSLS